MEGSGEEKNNKLTWSEVMATGPACLRNLPTVASPASRLRKAAVQSAWNLPTCRATASFWASEKVFRVGGREVGRKGA